MLTIRLHLELTMQVAWLLWKEINSIKLNVKGENISSGNILVSDGK